VNEWTALPVCDGVSDCAYSTFELCTSFSDFLVFFKLI